MSKITILTATEHSEWLFSGVLSAGLSARPWPALWLGYDRQSLVVTVPARECAQFCRNISVVMCIACFKEVGIYVLSQNFWQISLESKEMHTYDIR